jgi:hypothetical protein
MTYFSHHAYLEDNEYSDNYRRSMLASIRKMEHLMLARGWIRRPFVPIDLSVKAGSPRYGYRYDRALTIIEKVAGQRSAESAGAAPPT